MMTYSFSRLDLYRQCPKTWYDRYILGNRDEGGEAATLGKVVHKALELMGEYQYDAKLSLTLAKDDEEVSAEFNENEALYLIRRAVLHPHGQREVHIVVPLDPSDDFSPQIQMFIDELVEWDEEKEALAINDFKTNRSPYQINGSYQLPLYAWGTSQVYGVEEVYGSYQFLREEEGSRIRGHLFTKEEMEKARKWAYDTATEIEQKLLTLKAGGNPEVLFPATPGTKCETCSLAVDCSTKKLSSDLIKQDQEGFLLFDEADDLKPLDVMTLEDAKRYAGEIMMFTQAADERKELVKGFVKQTGQKVPVGEGKDQKIYGFSQNVSWSFQDKHAVMQALVDKGLDPWNFISFTADIKTILSEEELSQLGVRKVTETFSARKPEGTSASRARKAKSASLSSTQEQNENNNNILPTIGA